MGRPKEKSKSMLVPLLAVAAVVLLGVLGVGVWFAFGRSQPGTIQLTTTPSDPVVLFDTRPVQATSSPFVIADVQPGEMHLIEVSKTGYQTWSQQVRVQPSQTLTLGPVVLVAQGGVGGVGIATGPGTPGGAGSAPPPAGTGFTLDSQPTGAKVFVDGRELPQRSPVTVTDLVPGPHALRVEGSTQYEAWQMQIQVNAGQVMPLPAAVLNLRAVSVEFRSTPDGARVSLLRGSERRSVGATPTRADVELAGGAWTVEITKDDFETYTQALSLSPSQPTTTVEATLTARQRVATVGPRPGGGGTRPPAGGGTTRPPAGGAAPAAGGTGTLRINTRPWSQVYVDGTLIGNTPQMNIPLRAGAHRVTLVNTEFNIRETITVNITAGATETKVLTLNPG